MNLLWNQMDLQRPPYRSSNVSLKEFDPRKFIETLDKILKDFKTFEILHSEAALLSRLIYRMKSKFRSDKGLKHMEKVNRALLNYLNMSIEKEYELLKQSTEISNNIVCLPSRQTLEYVLVRTQGFAKLMCRVESTAIIAANILKSRLQIGQSWTVAMIAYAVISRIWILSRHIIKKSCTWYNNIYNYIESFKVIGVPWMPEDYTLPKDLLQWLELPWINEDVQKLPMKSDWNKSIFNLIQMSNEDEENLSFTDDVNVESSEKEVQNESISLQQDDDVGETISRFDFEETNKKLKKEKPAKVKKKKNSKNGKSDKKSKLLEIKTEKDLVQLLKTDCVPGLDKLKWNILRKRLKKVLIKLTKNNTCELDTNSYKKINRLLKNWTTST